MNPAPFRSAVLFLCALAVVSAPIAAGGVPEIAVAPASGCQAERAAREVRRYFYLRCGALLDIRRDAGHPPVSGIVLARKDSALLPAELKRLTSGFGQEDYLVKTAGAGDTRVDWIVGGGDIGVLYGAYRFAEKLGVRFYLHDDVIPDEPVSWRAQPAFAETGRPLFATRGILPFHDFPEGPDWWTADDYALYVGQLPKMRMNFLGLHCYPESRVGPEPLVWIGTKDDLDASGKPTFSYPASWFNSLVDRWGFARARTSDFASGAGLLFESDYVGSPVMDGHFPVPSTPAECNQLFAHTGTFLADVFARAHAVGVKVAVGTETPLTIPAAVARQLESKGQDPKDPATVAALYEGMFQRIARICPVDYYWLWTPEIWTWSGNDPKQFNATVADIQAAQHALGALGHPFTLATAGWVLGPFGNRTALDHLLAKDSPMSCISREVGHQLVEPGFAEVQGRPKWSMPWVENDPNLTAPQLWVGRMRYDAVDSLKLGCTGIALNHWRTRIMAPNIAAMADAEWDQSYAPKNWDVRAGQEHWHVPRDKKILGGTEFYSERPVAGTDESFIYQHAREGLEGYDLFVPDGRYTVTLRFNEPAATRRGERVMALELEGKVVEPSLDIYARVGANHALDLAYQDIPVSGNNLSVRFRALAGQTCVSALTIEGVTTAGEKFSRKMRCGRIEPVLEYEGDREGDRPTATARNRSMPTKDFYTDFARAHFGSAVAERAGLLFAQVDGTQLPELGTWIHGPGGINARAIASPAFGAMHRFAELRREVRGNGNRERFDYWLNTFRAFETAAEIAAQRATLDRVVAEGLNTTDRTVAQSRGEQALQLRLSMARGWEKMMTFLVATVSTPGELGTIADFEQHNRLKLGFLSVYDAQIATLCRHPLPPALALDSAYRGKPKLIVLSPRNSAEPNEPLDLRIIALDAGTPRSLQLHWRRLGEKEFTVRDAAHLARNTYHVILPAGPDDLEYFVSGASSTGQTLLWPATAPGMNHTVIHVTTQPSHAASPRPGKAASVR